MHFSRYIHQKSKGRKPKSFNGIAAARFATNADGLTTGILKMLNGKHFKRTSIFNEGWKAVYDAGT
jgi:hypothetical protein